MSYHMVVDRRGAMRLLCGGLASYGTTFGSATGKDAPSPPTQDEAKYGPDPATAIRLLNGARITLVGGQRAIDVRTFGSGVLLINYWGYWCSNCIAEFSSIKSLQDSVGKDTLTVLIVSDIKDLAKDISFAQTHGITFPLAFYRPDDIPDADFARLMRGKVNPTGVKFGLPVTYVLSRSRHLVASRVGISDWSSPELRQAIETLSKN